MKKIELLAPAKDLFKAKIAVMYGADAIYIGGKNFSLRSRASNFSLEEIKEIVDFAHLRNVKVFVTVNIVFHDEDFTGIKEYLVDLERIGVDAVIVTSLAVLLIGRKIAPNLEYHISTQNSAINSDAVNYYASLGADRVVLGRECSMDDIEKIVNNSEVPIEAFIHGGMCSNYSGRCTLSNRMTNRDANRGGCAHSCRWKYRLYDNGALVSNENCPFSMSSKDLRASAYIERMIKAGVTSLKIEGRMKSEYYIAQVVKTYRKMIDEVYEVGGITPQRLAYYDAELEKAENRLSDDGFLSGTCDNSKHLYGVNGAGVTHDYVAIVKDFDENRSVATIEVKNIFEQGDTLEVFSQSVDNEQFVCNIMFDEEWKQVSVANKPTQIIYMRMPFKVEKYTMMRKVHTYDN